MKIRVLIVDDSVVARRVLSDIVAADAELEVAGTAPNGAIGLQRITQVNPDAIILDCEMPVLNGIQTLEAVRKTYPALPVIMFSTNSEGGAAATIEALSKGASDFITKPASVGDGRALVTSLGEELVRKVKSLTARRRPAAVITPVIAAPAILRSTPTPTTLRRHRIDVVAIGCSTGGPAALGDVLPKIDTKLAVPIVIVQHMPPMFTRMLAERLTTLCQFPVHEAADGMPVLAGHCYIAPGNFHMTIHRLNNALMLRTNQLPPENSCRPSVDVLFRSVAETFGPNALSIVLTGMGQDGLRGIEQVHASAGTVWAQDEPTSVVWGMPGFVAKSGLAEKVLPLQEFAPAIVRRVQEFRPTAISSFANSSR